MNTQKRLYALLLSPVLSTPVLALEPSSIEFETSSLTPMLEVSEAYDDNVSATTTKQSSWVTKINPSVNFELYGEKTTYTIDYLLEHTMYHESGLDSITNHSLNAQALLDIDVRNQLTFEAGYIDATSIADVYTTGFDNQFITKNAGLSYVYGSPTATGNIEFGANHVIYESGNSANTDLNRDSNTLNLAFLYRASDRTRLLAEVKSTSYDYYNTNLDSQNTAFLVGARWESTALTTGSAKIGTETKDFSDPALSNTNLTNWEASIDWAPLTYSVLTLTTSQKIDEGNYGATYSNSRINDLKWRHDWGKGYTSIATYSNIEEDFQTGRLDNTTAYGIGVQYQARRWLEFAFDIQHRDQTSSIANQDYDRNIYQLTVNASL